MVWHEQYIRKYCKYCKFSPDSDKEDTKTHARSDKWFNNEQEMSDHSRLCTDKENQEGKHSGYYGLTWRILYKYCRIL